MEHAPLHPERVNSLVLENINQSMERLGSKMKWARPPEYLPVYESLKGKKVMMVDDVAIQIENHLPDIAVATDGHASFILYEGQDAEAVAEEIIHENPDTVLLDYSLSDTVKGTSVASFLQKKGFAGKIVGFSSERAAIQAFRENGVDFCIQKSDLTPEEAVQQLAQAFI